MFHKQNGAEIWVNVNNVYSVWRHPDFSYTAIGIEGSDFYQVIESVADVLAAIKGD
jgi:hypothetical protein